MQAEAMIMILLCNSPYMIMDYHQGQMTYFYMDGFGKLKPEYQEYIHKRIADKEIPKFTINDARVDCKYVSDS